MSDLERVTTTVTLLDLIPGDPPAIVTFERLVGTDGKTKPFTQKIPVPDASLFRSLAAEAAKGDLINVTTVTDWAAEGLPTHLASFSIVRGVSSAAQEPTTAGRPPLSP